VIGVKEPGEDRRIGADDRSTSDCRPGVDASTTDRFLPSRPEADIADSSRRDQLCLARRRICSGVCPVRMRVTFVKWEASENPARRPISAVVMRSKSGD
jgi:hypothetical protein